jgi:hypothetical protein
VKQYLINRLDKESDRNRSRQMLLLKIEVTLAVPSAPAVDSCPTPVHSANQV